MAGPYPHDYGVGAGGQAYPGQPFGTQPRYGNQFPGAQARPAQPYPEPAVPSAYPGMLPPPVPYPKRRRWPTIGLALLALAVVATVAALAYVIGRDDAADTAMTPDAAQTAIQGYLDALSDADTEAVARNTLCGMYDGVRDRRSDQALAKLSSDAFRKQFDTAEVTSIDKMVFSSANQAQVLFTMRVAPPGGSSTRNPVPEEEQGVAQLLSQDDEILVCSYLLRTAGQY